MRQIIDALKEQTGKVLVGRERATTLCLTALLAGGHVLIEDMPGTGKTMLAKTLSACIGASFSRIQFTPDLLPSDITGLHVYRPSDAEFILKKGPVFSNIILADEINRATPRTQSALLECMEEHQVTIDGQTFVLDEPFFVIATQNPIEMSGTFPLPEAQLDRFCMKLGMGDMSEEEELAMMERFEASDPVAAIERVAGAEDVLKLRGEAAKVYLHPDMKRYIISICRTTRESGRIMCGVSPRAELVFAACAKAYAYIDGRDHVVPEDIQSLAVNVLAHRMILSPELKRNGGGERAILEIIRTLPVPTENWRG